MRKTLSNFSNHYGPWALVAGASEGLGAAFAEELARRGLSVVLLARRAHLLQDLSDRLASDYNVNTRVYSLDLSNEDAVLEFASQMATLDLGLLVYNAAYAPIGRFLDLPLSDILKVIDVNVRGPLLLTHSLAPRMVERGRGGIVLMSSLAGLQGTPKLATYASSKAFGTILAESLWGELRAHGVDVLASCAGAIRTPGYVSSEKGPEAPGTMDASAVASQTLDALGQGPRVVPGLVNQLAHYLVGRWLPRTTAIKIMQRNTETLS